MEGLRLKIVDKNMQILVENMGEDEVNLVYDREYQPGDKIVLEIPNEMEYLWFQVDDALGRSLVYVTGTVTYQIPFGEKRVNLSPKAFYGHRHLLCAKRAMPFEIQAYRNLAINVCNQHKIINCYPNIVANVETRGEAVFAAQNAIDGVTINTSHGEWPYESWGINMQDDARIRLEFGRMVEVDCIMLYTRADFPHDNWWKQVHFTFSDGSDLECNLEKSYKPHKITMDKKKISWIEMHDMKKADNPSPFPALTQIEVYGRDMVL